ETGGARGWCDVSGVDEDIHAVCGDVVARGRGVLRPRDTHFQSVRAAWECWRRIKERLVDLARRVQVDDGLGATIDRNGGLAVPRSRCDVEPRLGTEELDGVEVARCARVVVIALEFPRAGGVAPSPAVRELIRPGSERVVVDGHRGRWGGVYDGVHAI